MSTTSGSTAHSPDFSKWSCSRSRSAKGSGRTQWSGMNIAVMVLGFVFFWPVGLLILGWILTGRHVRDLPSAVRQIWNQFFSSQDVPFMKQSDNIVFNEYQQTQYDRISEIKNEIREQSRRFGEFRMNARRRADQAEFREFMASSPDSDKPEAV